MEKNASGLIHKTLECPLCLNRFNLTDHTPMMLSCKAHTVCLDCLNSVLDEKQPKCPFDRHIIFKDLNSFSKSEFHINLINVYDSSATSRSESTEISKTSINIIHLELVSILESLNYTSANTTWIDDFIKKFIKINIKAVDEFSHKFGVSDMKKLHEMIRKNKQLFKINDSNRNAGAIEEVRNAGAIEEVNLKSSDVEEESIEKVITQILLNYGYKRENYEWIADFIEDFKLKHLQVFDDYESKFGFKDSNNIKSDFMKNKQLLMFADNCQNTSVSKVSLELDKILLSLGYSDDAEPWINEFTQSFENKGKDTIPEYESKFGQKDANKLKKLVEENKILSRYFGNNSSSNISLQTVSNELTKILSEVNYEHENFPWLTDFIEQFEANGELAIKNFESKFGLKDSTLLKEKISRNIKLNSYAKSRANSTTMVSDDFENKSIRKKTKKEIAVLVLGATGAGKSSLINLLYLWSQGYENIKDVKEALIPTKFLPGKTNTESNDVTRLDLNQTQKSFVHKFQLKTDECIYDLSLMDTPGFGDVRGIQKDNEYTDNILDTVSKKYELNCIILMMNGSDPRLTDRNKYIFHCLTGIIPNVVRENLIVLLSNVRNTPNLDFRKALNINVPQERVFFIDNLIFGVDIAKTEYLNELDFEFKKLKDKVSTILFTAAKLKVTSTDNFRKLKEKRDLFKIEIDKLRTFLIIKNYNFNLQKKEEKIDKDIYNIKIKIYDLLQDLQTVCSEFNYVKELELTKAMLTERIEYLQGEYGRNEDATALQEMESAIASEKIINEMMQIMSSNDLSQNTDNRYVENPFKSQDKKEFFRKILNKLT